MSINGNEELNMQISHTWMEDCKFSHDGTLKTLKAGHNIQYNVIIMSLMQESAEHPKIPLVGPQR